MNCLRWIVACTGLLTGLHSGPFCGSIRGDEVQRGSLEQELSQTKGLCIFVGVTDQSLAALQNTEGWLVHCLDPARERVADSTARLPEFAGHRILVEQWETSWLPHASRLADLIVVNRQNWIEGQDIDRVLRPGGSLLTWDGTGYSKNVKPGDTKTDEWTHQWHSADGGLTTEDERIGVPTGVQWLSGPLFAMAGRKSSTQTLVSAGGVNFYVTQNVLENVGKPIEEMGQFLVARNAYNGLLLWKRPWGGPFVTGDGETNPRLVASQERLWAVIDAHTIASLDASSGDFIGSHAVSGEIASILHRDSSLLVESATGLFALDDDLQHMQWEYPGRNLSGLTLSRESLFALDSGRAADGSFVHELVCLDAASGKERFRTDTRPHVTAARVRVNFAQDGIVALQAHGSLHVFSDDGEHLWSRSTEARPGKSYVDERYVGHFYRHGLIWMLAQNSPRESAGQNVWLGLHPTSGEQVRELATQGEWPRTATPAKMGCQILLASDQYIMIPRQSTFIDFADGSKHSFKFTRGGCGLGFVAANGLTYSHPHACGCFSEAVRGFMGMHSEPVSQLHDADRAPPRVSHYARASLQERRSTGADWPTYRSNGHRSAYSSTGLHAVDDRQELALCWQEPVATDDAHPARAAWNLRTGNRVSACTIVDDTVFVADIDAGRLCALDVETGRLHWTFVASGRIDTPPTITQGVCVFGAHDGYVYCLDAASGQLAWKCRVAPNDRRMVAFGSLESAWPVAGTVLVRDGLAYASAGRAPDADGGIVVAAIELSTGTPVWTQTLFGGEFWGVNDFLVAGDKSLYLSNWEFDPRTGENAQAKPISPHLRGGKVGLLEASWTKHDLALRKDIQTWSANGLQGQLIVFGGETSACYDAEHRRVVIETEQKTEVAFAANEQVTAMALTPGLLVVAGGIEGSDVGRGGFLRTIDVATGRVLQSVPLPAEAAWDAVAVSGNRILVSTQAGSVCCFEAR